MKKTAIIIVALMLAFLAGCDDGGGGSDGDSPPNPCDIAINPYAHTSVVWGVDAAGDLYYQNHDPSKVVEQAFPDHREVTVVWNCVDYQDDDGTVYTNVLAQFVFEAWAGFDMSWKLSYKRFEKGICDPACL